MRKTLILIFLGWITFSLSAFTSSSTATSKQFHKSLNGTSLGISIVLYRVGKADKVDDLSNLEKQMDRSKSINLYEITEDLGIIFMNTSNPYGDTAALPYKMLFGSYVEKQVGNTVVNGFVSTSEVPTICNWIRKHKLNSFEGFSKMYDSLSDDAKQGLEDTGADDKNALYKGYVQPLTQFYFAAEKNKNSIVICGE